MPNPTSDARPSRLRSRLEASLMRLHAAVCHGAQREETSETLYSQWQDRWTGRRDELSRRLSAIDSQLDSWSRHNSDTPRLAVLRESDEAVTGAEISSIEIG